MSDNTDKPSATIGDDLLWGAEAIGAEINLPKEKIYNLHRGNRLPIDKCGKTLIASRSKLRRFLLGR